VVTLIWIVCLVGAAFAMKVKVGLPRLAIPEVAEATAQETEPEPATEAQSAATEQISQPAAKSPDLPKRSKTEPRELIPAPRVVEDTKQTSTPSADPRADLLPPDTKCVSTSAPNPDGKRQVAEMNVVPVSNESSGAWNGPRSVADYEVHAPGETMREIARATLGSADRWLEVFLLNPQYRPELRIPGGVTLHLPSEARVVEEARYQPGPPCAPTPLPWHESARGPAQPPVVLCMWSSVRGKKPSTERGKHGGNPRPFIGTHLCALDDDQCLVLPQRVSEQMCNPRRLYLTPGPDECLWVCDATALERLTSRLAPSARRLYFAQTAQVTVDRSGRIVVPEWLSPVAALHQDVILLGVGDHFELWDTQHLQRYLDERSAGH
jgi:MraZ protein